MVLHSKTMGHVCEFGSTFLLNGQIANRPTPKFQLVTARANRTTSLFLLHRISKNSAVVVNRTCTT